MGRASGAAAEEEEERVRLDILLFGCVGKQ